MMHHVGMPPRYTAVAPGVPTGRSLLPNTPPIIPQFGGSSVPMQMYLHGIAQRENMLRSAFADYLKPVCTPDGEILLDVECGENRGMLYLSRFCQGSKGPCIRFDDMWLTPNEFQYISGRESAKDWKRSIRHQGKSLKLLLAKGILTVHQSSCSCTGCRISSPVNRGRLANCNPRFGYESMFEFAEKPLPHLMGNFQTTNDADTADIAHSPSNPSHSSKESSEFSTSGFHEMGKLRNPMEDSFTERKSGLSSMQLPRRTAYSNGILPKDFGRLFQSQGPGTATKDHPVCKPVAQMFSGVSAEQNLEAIQSILRNSGGVGPNIATSSSAFYPFGLNAGQPAETLSPRSSSTNSPSPSSVLSEIPPSPPEDDQKHQQPLDLSTSRPGKMVNNNGRHNKSNNPPPSEHCISPYGTRMRAVKSPYARPGLTGTNGAATTRTHSVTRPTTYRENELPGHPQSFAVSEQWESRTWSEETSRTFNAAAASCASDHGSDGDSESEDLDRSRSV